MSEEFAANLKHEWILLQHKYDDYEKYSFITKLQAVFIILIAVSAKVIFFPAILLVGIHWFFDTKWRTYQARVEKRQLAIEQSLSEELLNASRANEVTEARPLLLNPQYGHNAEGIKSVVKEYATQSINPAVAIVYLSSLFFVCVPAFIAGF